MPQVDSIQISVINASTVLADDEIQPVVGALQKQVNNEFRSAWGIDAKLEFVPMECSHRKELGGWPFWMTQIRQALSGITM